MFFIFLKLLYEYPRQKINRSSHKGRGGQMAGRGVLSDKRTRENILARLAYRDTMRK